MSTGAFQRPKQDEGPSIRSQKRVGSCLLFFTVPMLPEAVADINISVSAVPVAPGPRSKSICLYLQLTRGAVLCVVL